MNVCFKERENDTSKIHIVRMTQKLWMICSEKEEPLILCVMFIVS